VGSVMFSNAWPSRAGVRFWESPFSLS